MAQYEDKSQHPESLAMSKKAYEEGCRHSEEEMYSRAKQSFELALEYGPDDPRAWFALGNCHDELRSPAKAEVCFRMSLRFSEPEEKSQVHFNLGNSLFDQGKHEAAIESYGSVSEESAAYDAAQKNMGLARNRLD
jgi:tetratricopeptide (TPR) repeat protein